MIEKCITASTRIAKLEAITRTSVADAIADLGGQNTTRIIVTDDSGVIICDSTEGNSTTGKYFLLPELVTAMDGNDVFCWNYDNGVMQSRSATPIISQGILLGCVYMAESDATQGGLIQSLRQSIFVISLALELAVILFSLSFSTVISQRLRRIMTSMRIIRSGDYTHKVKMGGNDELTVLGDEFNEMAKMLYTSEQKRQQFVSDASHELKTPLASIKLLTDSILQNNMDSETTREFVSDIGAEADRLNRMTEKLLALSKLDNSQDDEYEIVYMAPTIMRIVRMLSATADERAVTVSTNLSEDCPILIRADDLYQIIFNLIENGIKYNVSGGRLSITLKRDADNVLLLIEDTGVGIPAESLEHVFERFYRVDKARSRKSGGSGLGLSIVRNMVERNHGQIYVNSVLGKGTVFTVEFPAFDPKEAVQ